MPATIILSGGGGADRLEGLAGNDSYIVDNAADVIVDTAGIDNVNTSVSYTLAANVAVETLRTTNANATTPITLVGNNLANLLIGNAGSNILVGGGGVDRLEGLAGNDSYWVDSAADVVIDTAGIDNVNASVSYTLARGLAMESLRTNSAVGTTAINLTGNEFANLIDGNAGSNALNGGLGNDKLTGNAGNDFFVFNTVLNATTNVDTITDFVVANDTVRLENSVFTGLVARHAQCRRLPHRDRGGRRRRPHHLQQSDRRAVVRRQRDRRRRRNQIRPVGAQPGVDQCRFRGGLSWKPPG